MTHCTHTHESDSSARRQNPVAPAADLRPAGRRGGDSSACRENPVAPGAGPCLAGQRRRLTRFALPFCLGAALVFGGGAAPALAQGAADTSAPQLSENTPSAQAVAQRLAGALRYPTISPADPADFEGAPFIELANYLAQTYPLTHARLQRRVVNQYSLFFEWKGLEPELAPVLFMSHLDVVPVEPGTEAQWTHPPYAGVIDGGMVWGRGALDVKGGVILWLEAVEALLAQGFRPARTIYLAFGHDEEIGGDQGAAAMAARLRDRGVRLALLFDEGGFILNDFPLLPGRTVAQVVTAEKAYLTVRLTARGSGGHSSAPPRHTAIGRLAGAIHRLEANPPSARLTEPVRQMLVALAPAMSLTTRLVFNNLWLTEPLVTRRFADGGIQEALTRTTMAATVIRGGVKENVLPEQAHALVNFRLLPGDTQEDILAHIRRHVGDPGIEVETVSYTPAPPPADSTGPGFMLAKHAVWSVLPQALVVPGLLTGATDTRHYADLADNAYRFIPIRVSMNQVPGIHGRDERIAVAGLDQSVAIAIEMVRRAGNMEAWRPGSPE